MGTDSVWFARLDAQFLRLAGFHVCYLSQQYWSRFWCLAKQKSLNSILKSERGTLVWCEVFPRTQCMKGEDLWLSIKQSFLFSLKKKDKHLFGVNWKYILGHIASGKHDKLSFRWEAGGRNRIPKVTLAEQAKVSNPLWWKTIYFLIFLSCSCYVSGKFWIPRIQEWMRKTNSLSCESYILIGTSVGTSGYKQPEPEFYGTLWKHDIMYI